MITFPSLTAGTYSGYFKVPEICPVTFIAYGTWSGALTLLVSENNGATYHDFSPADPADGVTGVDFSITADVQTCFIAGPGQLFRIVVGASSTVTVSVGGRYVDKGEGAPTTV